MTQDEQIALDAMWSKIEPWSEYRAKAARMNKTFGSTTRYKTLWPEFNDFLGGGFGATEDGELVVVMGDTGIGKSTFVANLAVHLVQSSGENIHFITLENSPEHVYNTVLRVSGKDELGSLENHFTSPSKQLIFNGPSWTPDQLLKHMDYVVNVRGIHLFVIDHLNFMFENEAESGEFQRVRNNMQRITKFCNANQVTIIAVTHINKRPEPKNKLNKNYLTLDRIYGSQSIAGAATKVLALNPQAGVNHRYVDVQLLKSRYTRERKQEGEFARFEVDTYEWKLESVNYDA